MRLLVRMIMCTMVYLYKRTGWLGVNLIGGDSTTEEGGAKVDGDAGKPYRMIQKSEVQITSIWLTIS